MLAVLNDAIRLVLRDGSAVDARCALRIRAAEWIGSNDCGWAFSFVNICEALGFAPEELRERVARLVRQRADLLQARAPAVLPRDAERIEAAPDPRDDAGAGIQLDRAVPIDG
jgi:hypothetical protein